MPSPYSITALTDSFDLIDLSDPPPTTSSLPHHTSPSSLPNLEEEDLISFDSPPRPSLSPSPSPRKKLSPLSPPFIPRKPPSCLYDLSPQRAQPIPKTEQEPLVKVYFPTQIYQSSTTSTPPRPVFTNPNKSRTVRDLGTGTSPGSNLPLQTSLLVPQRPAQTTSQPFPSLSMPTLKSLAKTASSATKIRQNTQIKLSHLFPDSSEEGVEVEVAKKKRPETTDAVIRRIVGRELGVSMVRRNDERSLEIERVLMGRKRWCGRRENENMTDGEGAPEENEAL